MPGGAVADARLAASDDVEQIEAPVTIKAYLMCAFASFGGIFFGYDSVSISLNQEVGRWMLITRLRGTSTVSPAQRLSSTSSKEKARHP